MKSIRCSCFLFSCLCLDLGQSLEDGTGCNSFVLEIIKVVLFVMIRDHKCSFGETKNLFSSKFLNYKNL